MNDYIQRLYMKALDCRDLALSSRVRDAQDRYNDAARYFEESAELFGKKEFSRSSFKLDMGYISLVQANTAEVIARTDSELRPRLVG